MEIDTTHDKTMSAAMNILSYRACSEKELSRKLYKKKFGKKTIEWTLKECLRLQLINDSYFTECYIEELMYKDFGIYYIKNALRKRGISQELIEKWCEEKITNENEIARLKNNITKKLNLLKREKDPRKKREKIFRFLCSRGFQSHIIYDNLNIEECDDEDSYY